MLHPRLLVTGARGFVGRSLIRLLARDELLASAVCISRSTDAFLPGGGSHIVADLGTKLDLPVHGADVVVHIAGEKRDVSRMQLVNTQGTSNLLDWSADHGVSRFVLVSSVGVYGARKNSGVVTETFPHSPANEYEATKDKAEQNTREFCQSHGIECVILQPSNVVGLQEGSDAFPLLGFMRSISRRLLVQFSRDAWMNYVAVDDVARALLCVCEKSVPDGTFILNESIRLTDVIETVASTLHTSPPTLRLPLALGLSLGVLGTIAERVLGRSLPIDRQRIRELTNNTRYDGSALERAAGFRYASGARATVAAIAASYSNAGLL